MKNKLPWSAVLALILLLAACRPKYGPAIYVPESVSTATKPAPEPTTDPYADSTTPEPISIGAFVEAGEISEQDLSESVVTVEKVNAAVDGWIVVHFEGADGKPGPVLGYTQVPAGESTNVKVKLDKLRGSLEAFTDPRLPKYFAMLHVDEGIKGKYEFPGADVPVKVGEMIVMQAFKRLEETMAKPSVTANEQSIVAGTVTIASVSMREPGWLAIHSEADGKPGPVIGYALLPIGEFEDIRVDIDESQATPKLFAMLHIDAGIVGTYEFPGNDVPIKDGDMVVMVPFEIK